VTPASDQSAARRRKSSPKRPIWGRVAPTVDHKEDDRSIEAFKRSDLDTGEIGELRTYESDLAMLLSEEDVTSLAAAIEAGSSAGVVVCENTWAAPFASAVRRSGSHLVASGRIPTQALLAAIEADEREEAAASGALSNRQFPTCHWPRESSIRRCG
jgi:Family of unknown function (DUF6325)